MARERITTCDLDPFEFTWIYGGLRKVHTAWLLVIGVLIIGLLWMATSIDGTLGDVKQVQIWADIRRVLGDSGVPASSPDFTLMRDVTSWFLVGVIIVSVLILHRQWQHISICLSTLAQSGALVALEDRKSNVFSKILGVDRIVSSAESKDALDTLVTKVTTWLARRTVWFLVLMILTALVLAKLLMLGQENGLFQTLAPRGLSPADREEWLDQAYRNWWAGNSHTFGNILYLVLAMFGIFVILSFQLTGIVCIYVAIAMHYVVAPSADWLNRDGRFGWSPMARVYRPVVWANAIMGATMTVVLASLGIDNYDWVVGLLVLYLVMMPIFVLVPWFAFRRVEEKARAVRIKEIEDLMESRGIDPDVDIEVAAPIVAEIDRCRTARIRPLRLGAASLSTYVLFVILPVVLAAAQIFFPLKFGSK
jgi:hypothetical protein